VSTSKVPAAETELESKEPSASGTTGVERRRRRRAKLSAEVRIRTVNSPTPFQEICKTVDVSRDGLLIVSPHSGYWKGQPLEVTFPFSSAPSALNQAQPAEVVRVFECGGGLFGVGVQFAARASGRQASAAHSDTQATSGARKETVAVVLAIEPDPQAADSLRNLLQPDGYTVVTVPTAQAALDVLKTTVPAAFITQDENPDISGHDLCLIARKNERLKHVPVILLTRSAQPVDYAASRELGAVICMTKPFTPDRLLQVIRLVAPPPTERSTYGAPVHKDAIVRDL
jgi:two-component system, chemotaxis family, chemotaxis protein CheY